MRREIEKHLIREREMLDDSAATPNLSIWTHVNVIQVDIEPRQILTPEGLAKMRKWDPDESADSILTRHDTPATQTKFMVIMEVSWDEDRQRWAPFRDGRLVSLSAESARWPPECGMKDAGLVMSDI